MSPELTWAALPAALPVATEDWSMFTPMKLRV